MASEALLIGAIAVWIAAALVPVPGTGGKAHLVSDWIYSHYAAVCILLILAAFVTKILEVPR